MEGRRRLLTGLAGAGQSSPRAAPPLSWRPQEAFRRRPKAPRSPIRLRMCFLAQGAQGSQTYRP